MTSWGEWVRESVVMLMQRLDSIIVALERVADAAEADLDEAQERHEKGD